MNDDNLFVGIILWAITGAMVLYFVIGLLAMWADRPSVGRSEYGTPRAVREVRRR